MNINNNYNSNNDMNDYNNNLSEIELNYLNNYNYKALSLEKLFLLNQLITNNNSDNRKNFILKNKLIQNNPQNQNPNPFQNYLYNSRKFWKYPNKQYKSKYKYKQFIK